MKHTVLGMFEYGIDAQMAAQQLMSIGLPSDQIDLIVGRSAEKKAERAEDTHKNEKSNRISNFFSSLFRDKHEADKYSRVAEHSAVITVHARSEEEARRAAEILDKYGAVDVDEHEEKLRERTAGDPAGIGTKGTAEPTGTIPVVEENVHVGKREEQTGGVRPRSRILERPVEENMRLREEHMHVERHSVDRPATDEDDLHFEAGEIEIVEHAEIPVVRKEQRVVEEIRLNKETIEHEETVRDTVRKQEVETERLRSNRDLRDTNTPEGSKNR